MDTLLDLKHTSGLDLKLDVKTARLLIGEGLTKPEPAIRTIDEMREVLADSSVKEPRDLYFMYRDLHATADNALLEKYKLRYDVTVIKADHLGGEFMKTAGHYHPGNYGELYEVLTGSAICVLQKCDLKDDSIIEDVIAVSAKAGEKIVIPPGYGHILVNPGPGFLVTSNWVSSLFASEYQLYKKAKGAAYFLFDPQGKAGESVRYSANKYFKELTAVRHALAAPKLDRFGLKKDSPIYPLIRVSPEKLDFLNRPMDFDYKDIFTYIL
ncbi:MAG: glucose-6-phosphate isomerase family protein [Candidatus Omnitrophica bacterium]|nr:glucose-6-phosphate isomerase family protein [Candidatus Omnitrophota bacterium]